MKVINFFGAPGAGKSTAALGLANEMKRAWLNCEYVSEFAKDQVWAETAHLLEKNPNWILANQEMRLSVLRGKVDFAISDSPLLNPAFYAPTDFPSSFTQLCFDLFARYDNVNFFVNRSHTYTGVGRLQNEMESDTIAAQMKAFLSSNGVKLIEISAGNSAPETMFNLLREMGITPAGTERH